MAMGVGLVIGRGDGDIGRKYAVCVVQMPRLYGSNGIFGGAWVCLFVG